MQMQFLLLIGALIVANVVAQKNPLLGSAAGLLINLGIGVWGWLAYDSGRGVSFLGQAMSRTVFLVFVGALAAYNIWHMIRVLKHR